MFVDLDKSFVMSCLLQIEHGMRFTMFSWRGSVYHSRLNLQLHPRVIAWVQRSGRLFGNVIFRISMTFCNLPTCDWKKGGWQCFLSYIDYFLPASYSISIESCFDLKRKTARITWSFLQHLRFPTCLLLPTRKLRVVDSRVQETRPIKIRSRLQAVLQYHHRLDGRGEALAQLIASYDQILKTRGYRPSRKRCILR